MTDLLFPALMTGGKPPVYRYFDGEKWTVSLSGKTTTIVSPVTGEVVGRVQVVSHAEIDQAVTRAREAQKAWQEVKLADRAKVLQLAADWMREHESVLTRLLILEIGKPYAEAKDEILRSADMLDAFAERVFNLSGEELSGEGFPGYDRTRMAIVEHVPVGTVLAIAPFNYPVNLSVSKLAPAIVTGNSVVFKPPTYGSLSGLYLTEIFRKAGLPDGVLVTLTGGGGEIGDYLATHGGIDMIMFTGSSTTGKHLAEEAKMIPLLLECGGNNPALVLSDADMVLTVNELVKGAFSYAGQRCTAIKYVLGLPETIDMLLPLVVRKTGETVKSGDPRSESNTMGPVITATAAEEADRRIILAKKMGARVVYGGTRSGRYLEPAILDNARPSMEIVHSETFGPVLSFIRVRSMEEAVRVVNESQYGLQASVFTADEGAGLSIARQLNVGTVQINSKPQRGPDHFPFMGVKGSGIGVQGIRYALEASTRLKSTVLNKPH